MRKVLVGFILGAVTACAGAAVAKDPDRIASKPGIPSDYVHEVRSVEIDGHKCIIVVGETYNALTMSCDWSPK
jgi:hypothetical protein